MYQTKKCLELEKGNVKLLLQNEGSSVPPVPLLPAVADGRPLRPEQAPGGRGGAAGDLVLLDGEGGVAEGGTRTGSKEAAPQGPPRHDGGGGGGGGDGGRGGEDGHKVDPGADDHHGAGGNM